MNERVIRVSDLFWFIIGRWKLLILAVVAGALLFGGAKWISSNKSASANKTAETVSIPAGLTAYDHAAVRLYLNYLSVAEEQSEYLENSDLMRLDPYQSFVSSVSYYAECAQESEMPAVLEYYAALLNSMKQEYTDAFTFSAETGYFGDYSPRDPGRSVIAAEMETGGSIRIRVFGAEEASCSKTAEEIAGRLEGFSAPADSPVHILRRLNAYTSAADPREIIDFQKNETDRLYSVTNNMNNIQKSLSDDALAYVKKVKSAKSTEPDGAKTGQTAAASGSGNRKSMIKAAVLGAAAILLLCVVLLALFYVFSRKLRSEDDITGLFNTSKLGIAETDPDKKRGLDRLIENGRRKSCGICPEPEEILAENIRSRAKSIGAASLYFTGTVFGEKEKQLSEKLGKILTEKGFTVTVGERIGANAPAMEEMGSAGCAVFVESDKVSRRPQIFNGLLYCRERRIEPLGIIVAL